MSTKRNDEELNLDQLSQIAGGEDGGFRREVPSVIGPKEGIFHENEDPSGGLLNDDQLSQIAGGEDGGFRREVPSVIGPKEGIFHENEDPSGGLLNGN